uniref:U-box domain-containing protein n=1 Tax=Nicotiana tabacum TaxID=4097 RepID=A0A1S4D1N8_TOBAC|nr:PREDICTED: U-box domain-containing protein 28-like isoform X3 [Nicotiana tabacum]XP_016507234.1 PREDICTED: U-box domain-containing protein 28-like isoform X4 [Nicotiana tabacum]
MMRNRREELYVTVPSLFRCPISMDVMKSPVSLCTGVTYDRNSIQTWLSQGHNTCPATMQILPSTDFTPNLTLRRLINVWLQHQPANSPSAATTPSSSPAVSKSEVLEIVKNINGENRLSSLVKIAEFVKYSDENRRFFVNSSGAIANVVGVLVDSDVVEICETVIAVLDLVVLENGVKEQLNKEVLRSDRDFLSKFLLILRKGKLSSRIQTARILEFIALDADSQRKFVEDQGLLYELHVFTRTETNRFAVEAGLSALIAISTTRPARKELVRFGIVQTVGKILSGSDSARVVVEKSLKLLETVATCTEGRAAIGKDEECLMAVVTRLMKSSRAATEHGVTVLWSVCCLARDTAAREVVGKVNGLTKVLLVMQSDCSTGARQTCGELVKALRVVNNNTSKNYSKSCLASYDTKTTHIMPY